MRAWGGAGVVVVALCAAGCDETVVDGRWRPRDWEYLQSFKRRPPSTAIVGDDIAAELGKAVFSDTSYAGAANTTVPRPAVSCATCHASPWFVDRTPSSLGVKWTGRNTIALTDVAYRAELSDPPSYTWDGGYQTLATVLTLPVLTPMASTKLAFAEAVRDNHGVDYRYLYGEFPIDPSTGDLDAETIFTNVAQAIEAYEWRLQTGDAPFDRYLDGNYGELTDAAKDGLELFVGDALCSECHDGPTFSDGGYHNTGVPQFGEHAKPIDHGRAGAMNCTGEACAQLEGAFRTPSLRNVAMSAPYMHAGQLASLGDVIDFYWRGGGDGNFVGTKDDLMQALPELDADQRAALVAFLQSLTGDPVDPRWYP